MTVQRCDSCKKVIKDKRGECLEIKVGFHWAEICKTCAGPIIGTIAENKLLPKKLLKELELA